ncbi:hypothetical protein MTO96_024487 [Rhipicephalus appendiculatus]
MLSIQSNLCLMYGKLDDQERKRYVNLRALAGTLCEFFGLMYLLDFVTSKQTESLSILQWLKLSLVLNIALCLITAKFCQSRPLKMFHSFAFRISGYLTVLAIFEFSEELEELECAR